MQTRGIINFIFLVFALILPFSSAHSQEVPSKNTPVAEESQVVEIKDLSNELEQQKAYFLEVDQSFDETLLEEIRTKLETLQSQSITVLLQADALLDQEVHLLSRQDFERVEAPLLIHKKNVSAAINAISMKVGQITEEESELVRREIRWKRTLAKVDKAESSEIAKKRSAVAYQEVLKAKKKLKIYLDKVLFLEGALSTLGENARGKIAALESAQVRFRKALLSSDSVALYSAEFWEMAGSSSLHSIFDSIVNQYKSVLAYFSVNTNRIFAHLLAFLLICWCVFKTKNTAFVQEAFPKLYDNPILLTVTSGLLLSLAFYPNAHQGLFNLLGLLLVLPLVLFFRDLLEKQYSLIIYGIAVLFLCDQIRGVLGEFPAISQLIFLFELLWGAHLARSFVTECDCVGKDNPEVKLGGVLWLFGQIGRFGAILLTIAAMLLCVGYYRLVLYVGETIFSAVYLGLVLFTIHRLSVGLILALLHTKIFNSLGSISRFREKIGHRLEQIITFIFLAFWLVDIFDGLGIKELLYAFINTVLATGINIGDTFLTIGGVLFGIIVVYLGVKLSQGLRLFLEEDLFTRRDFSPAIKSTIDTAVHWTVLLIALFMGLSAVGIGFRNLALIAGALSVGIGFGLQNIVNNFVSGIILLVERPIKVGDLILIGETLGNVTRIGMRSSTIRTLDEAEIIIPNANLVSENVINWTLTSRRARISVAVGVAYGSDVETCMIILREAAQSEEYILDFPEPSVLFKEFGDSSLNFEVRGWIRNFQEHPEHKSALTVAISRALAANNFEIPFPQRDVHMIPAPEKKLSNKGS